MPIRFLRWKETVDLFPKGIRGKTWQLDSKSLVHVANQYHQPVALGATNNSFWRLCAALLEHVHTYTRLAGAEKKNHVVITRALRPTRVWHTCMMRMNDDDDDQKVISVVDRLWDEKGFFYWHTHKVWLLVVSSREHHTKWFEMEQEFMEQVSRVPKIKFHSTRSHWRRWMPFRQIWKPWRRR